MAATTAEAEVTIPMTDAARKKHPARRSRIAAMGVGVAAMAGLVGNMEVAGRAHAAATPSPSPTLPSFAQETAQRHAEAADRAVAVTVRYPIVLTPHAVVHTVQAPAPAAPSYVGSSGGYSGGAVYTAPRAAAPVASSGGSHP
jgi:hypothetical protein